MSDEIAELFEATDPNGGTSDPDLTADPSEQRAGDREFSEALESDLTADPDGSDPDPAAEMEPGTWVDRVADVLKEVPERDFRDADPSELWDPEEGAENRLLFVLEEVVGGGGVPNWAHALIGTGEAVMKHGAAVEAEDDEDAEGGIY